MPNQQFLHARIWVIDDQPANVLLLEDILEGEGFHNITSFTDPRRAVAELTRDEISPDLILLDIRMPHLSGYQVLAAVQEHLGETAPPIIVLTAQTDDETRDKALDAGALDFLTKPFNHAEVLKRIRNVLEVQRRNKNERERSATLETMVAERTAELERISLQDPLTKLPNRRAILAEVSYKLNLQQPFAIAFMAIDHLDETAKLHGHSVMEGVYAEIASVLAQSRVARNCFLGHWGSHEFIFVLPSESQQTIESTLKRLLLLVSGKYEYQQLQISVECRIGVSIHQQHRGQNCGEELIRQAMLAIPNVASEQPWRFYSQELTNALNAREQMRRELSVAHTSGQLSLCYQPKIQLQSQRCCGAEALLRWHHPEQGLISPAVFIPVAEASNAILSIGAWVLNEAIQQLGQWLQQGVVSNDFVLAINVAAPQFRASAIAQSIADLCARYEVPSQQIQIEITESSLLHNLEDTITQLNAVRALGATVAIDDFGTGYSSLAYLKTLPIDVLKIDRAFVTDLHTNSADFRVAQTITNLAHNLHCQVVAEGIELAEQAELLTTMGCEMGQGYLYAKPLSASDFVEYIEKKRAP